MFYKFLINSHKHHYSLASNHTNVLLIIDINYFYWSLIVYYNFSYFY